MCHCSPPADCPPWEAYGFCPPTTAEWAVIALVVGGGIAILWYIHHVQNGEETRGDSA